MSRKIPKELWETYRAMSVDVGKLIPFLRSTSCMNPDERKNIAYCEMMKKMFEGDKEFVEFLDELAIPFFEYLGRAKWNRDVVSDLGFALALQSPKRQDARKIIQYKPPKK